MIEHEYIHIVFEENTITNNGKLKKK